MTAFQRYTPCPADLGKSVTRQSLRRRLIPTCSSLSGARSGFAGSSAVGGSAGGTSYSCSARKSCSQMTSCAEARFQLEQCGNTKLDSNGDGVPCESLCR
ncbi:Excalibur calcium-binding domain protein [compost metagenome]